MASEHHREATRQARTLHPLHRRQGVHLGNTIDEGTGTVRTPLVMANSYRLKQDPSTMDWSAADGLVYIRNSGANQVSLQHKLAALGTR